MLENKAYIKAFYTDLHAYNSGIFAGDWIDLDDNYQDAISEVVSREFPDLHDDLAPVDHEFFITDYDTNLSINVCKEHPDLDQLVDLVNVINSNGVDPEIANVILNECVSIDQAVRIIENGDFSVFYTEGDSDFDLGYAAAEESEILSDVPENVARYFDYAAYGRDIRIDSCGDFSADKKYYVYIY